MKRGASQHGQSISPPPTKRRVESTTTSRAVASFFKPTSQREPEKLTWRVCDQTLLVGHHMPSLEPPSQTPSSVKIAAFDLDDTLIKPKQGGARFSRTATSHVWWDSAVPGRLGQLHKDGYTVAILTNQNGISLKENAKSLQRDTVSLQNFKDQLTSFMRQMAVPVRILAATGKDRYRKPQTGMWDELASILTEDGVTKIDMVNSFYIGDAAGRERTDRGTKDHATSDRDLAANIGVKFQTPEEFFLGLETEPYTHLFEPKQFLESALHNSRPQSPFKKANPQELVAMCGSPGAGKSSFFWNHLQPQGFQRVNQDILKTREKCIKVARQLLSEGSSVAVDNTNRNKEARAHWVRIAKEFSIPIRCVLFTASARLCEHNDAVRANNKSLNPENRTILPGIAFTSFAKSYTEPQLDEGFQDITRVNFEYTGTDEEKALWSKYWVSKFST